jgi:hypothetical protein
MGEALMSVSDGGTDAGQPAGKEPFPWNRIVAFLGPYLAIVSGALATWLLAHFPGLHVNQSTLAANLSEAAVFIVAAAGTFAMHHKWLDGWQQWEKGLTDVAGLAEQLHPAGLYDPAEFPAEIFGASPAPLPAVPAALAATPAQVPEFVMAGLPPARPSADGATLMAPPLVDRPIAPAVLPAQGSAQASTALPSGDQELSSVPDPDESADSRPESATTPDVPADELEKEDF